MRHDSAKRHIWGLRTPGGYDPEFELDRDFCAMHLPPKFHYPMFTRSVVIVLIHKHKHTHKQTDAAENIQRSSLRYDVG